MADVARRGWDAVSEDSACNGQGRVLLDGPVTSMQTSLVLVTNIGNLILPPDPPAVTSIAFAADLE